MKKLFHWAISVLAATAIATMIFGLLLLIGYMLYLCATEATILFGALIIVGIAYRIGSYIENHGWAWNPHEDSAE